MSETAAATTAPRERFAVSQLMLPHTTFEEDINACADLGFGLGVSEAKLPDFDDNLNVLAMREKRACLLVYACRV